jgi:hypothetical protein
MPLLSIRVVGSSAGGKAVGILFARQVWQPAWPSDLSDCGHNRDIAHRRESGLGGNSSTSWPANRLTTSSSAGSPFPSNRSAETRTSTTASG